MKSIAKLYGAICAHRFLLYLYAANLLCVGVALSCLLVRAHFSPESYLALSPEGIDFSSAESHLRVGSFCNYVMYSLQQLIGTNAVLDQKLFYVLLIVGTSLATTSISRTISSLLEQPRVIRIAAINLAVLIVFINPFAMESFLFPENAAFYALGNVMLALAVRMIVRFSWRRALLSSLFLIGALGVNQVYFGLYVSFALFICWYANTEKGDCSDSLMRRCRGLLCAVAAVLIHSVSVYLLQAFAGDMQSAGAVPPIVQEYSESMAAILVWQPLLIANALGPTLTPFFAFIMLTCLFLTIYSLKGIGAKRTTQFCIAFFFSYLAVFVPHLTMSSPLSFGNTLGLWAVFVCFLVLPTLLKQSQKKEVAQQEAPFSVRACSPLFSLATSIVCVLVLASNSVASDVARDNNLTVLTDRRQAMAINARLDTYERETGNQVQYICYTRDINPQQCYPNIQYPAYRTSQRAFSADSSVVAILNYYGSGSRTLYHAPKEMPQDIFKRYFVNKDWDEFSPDHELVIVDDTAYLVMY